MLLVLSLVIASLGTWTTISGATKFTAYYIMSDVSGVHFQKALFVPNQSVFNKVGSHTMPSSDPPVDLSWQLTLQRVWESLIHSDKGTGHCICML